MPTPAQREPVRIARGTYCSLNSAREDLLDGEIAYAEDLRALFMAEERNGRMELNAVRTTIRPEVAPPLRFHGFLDLKNPPPAQLQHGDLVVAVQERDAKDIHPSWGIGVNVPAGAVLVFDDALGGFAVEGGLLQLPRFPLDLSKLPVLP